MGMFDEVDFDYRMPDGYESPAGYQTKSLEGVGDRFAITPSGRLVRVFCSGWPDDGRPLTDLAFEGRLTIYAIERGLRVRHDYDLIFVNGTLDKIRCHQTGGALLFDPHDTSRCEGAGAPS